MVTQVNEPERIMVPPKSKGGRKPAYSEEHPKRMKQWRMEARIAWDTRHKLQPLADKRIMADAMVECALGLGLLETLKLLSTEVLVPHEVTAVVWYTPNQALLDKAAKWYLGPQILIRAAAIKLADKLEKDRLREITRQPDQPDDNEPREEVAEEDDF